jgi:tetratricopeptide (TPR) repeat protein
MSDLTNDEDNDVLSTALRVTETVKNADAYDELSAAIALRYADREDYDRAVQIADTINDPYMRERTVADIAVKGARAGHEEYAFELLGSLEDLSHESTAATVIAIDHADAGRFDRAVEIASNLDDNSTLLAEIATKCAAAGDADRALEIAETVDDPLHKSLALTRIAEAEIKAGHTDSASDAIELAMEESNEIDSSDERATTRAEIALRFSDLARPEDAAGVLAHAAEDAEAAVEPYKDTSYAEIATSHARLKDYEVALEVAEKIDDVYVAANTLARIAVIEHGDEEREAESLQLLQDAFELLTDEVPQSEREESQRSNILSQIALNYADFHQRAKAIKAAEAIGPQHERDFALIGVALRLIETEDIDGALSTVRSIPDQTYSLNGLLRLSRSLISNEAERDRGLGLVAEAQKLLEKIESPLDRVIALAQMATIFADVDQKQRAEILIRQAVEESRSITREFDKASALISIADPYAKIGFEPDDEFNELLWQVPLGFGSAMSD